MRRPFFSVVTPALNCARLLPRNLASVRGQGLPAGEIEHWVIDGGSQDGTVELLREADVKFLSEPDRGLSDAVNKGVQRATGQWIVWLNADDELAPGALRSFMEAQRQFPDVRMFCGGQKVFGYDGRLEGISEGWDYNLRDLLGMRTSIVQASTFVHRDVYEEVGLLDVACRDAMDYEWTVRAMHRFRCQPLPVVLTHYHRRPGSIMDANMAAFYRTFLRVRRQYGLSRLAPAEWRIRFYLATEPLRRVPWIRKRVRSIKRIFGAEPTHPFGDGRTTGADVSHGPIEVLHVIGGSSSLGGVMSFVRSLTEGDTSGVKHFIWKSREFQPPTGGCAQWVCEGRAKLTDRSLASDVLGAMQDVPRLESWLRRHPRAILHAHSRIGHIACSWIGWRTKNRPVMHMHARSNRPHLYRKLWRISHAKPVFNSDGTRRHFDWNTPPPLVIMPTIAWPERPPPPPAASQASGIRFIASSLFVPWKNVLQIVAAFNQFSANQPHARLTVFGTAADPKTCGYQRKIEGEARLNPGVQLMGWDTTWKDQLTAADIFVHAAKNEPFGIVMLEAFARGCRMVVPMKTFLDDLPEPLNAAGIIRTDAIDLGTLAEAMEAATHIPTSGAALWEARRAVRELFSANNAGARLLKIYETVQAGSRTEDKDAE